jgi:hypothetical protein
MHLLTVHLALGQLNVLPILSLSDKFGSTSKTLPARLGVNESDWRSLF